MFTWQDLLYLIALLIGVLLVVGNALGLGELSAPAEVADPALAFDADADVDTAAGGHDGVLELLGLGRVPLSVLSLAASLAFGGSGLALGPVCRALLGPSLGPWISLALAGLASLVCTAALGRVFTRRLPMLETYASRKQELLGLAGRVIVCAPDGDAILAVVDDGGAELRIRARIESGSSPAGTRVAISGYDPGRDLFLASSVSEPRSGRSLPSSTTNTKERERSR